MEAVQRLVGEGRMSPHEQEVVKGIYSDLAPIREGKRPGVDYTAAFWAALDEKLGTARGGALKPNIMSYSNVVAQEWTLHHQQQQQQQQ